MLTGLVIVIDPLGYGGKTAPPASIVCPPNEASAKYWPKPPRIAHLPFPLGSKANPKRGASWPQREKNCEPGVSGSPKYRMPGGAFGNTLDCAPSRIQAL